MRPAKVLQIPIGTQVLIQLSCQKLSGSTVNGQRFMFQVNQAAHLYVSGQPGSSCAYERFDNISSRPSPSKNSTFVILTICTCQHFLWNPDSQFTSTCFRVNSINSTLHTAQKIIQISPKIRKEGGQSAIHLTATSLISNGSYCHLSSRSNKVFNILLLTYLFFIFKLKTS